MLIVETNFWFAPGDDLVMPRNETFMWNMAKEEVYYCGMSLLAAKLLGEQKGYTLVHNTKEGVNAFFVRNDVLKEKNV